MGVAPLVVADGRRRRDAAVAWDGRFSGMLGVTGFGLLFTPAFYAVVRKFGRKAVQPTETAPAT